MWSLPRIAPPRLERGDQRGRDQPPGEHIGDVVNPERDPVESGNEHDASRRLPTRPPAPQRRKDHEQEYEYGNGADKRVAGRKAEPGAVAVGVSKLGRARAITSLSTNPSMPPAVILNRRPPRQPVGTT